MSKDFKKPEPPESEPQTLQPKPLMFSSEVSIKGKDFPLYKSVATDLGVKLPFPGNDSTKVVAGVEARVSVFNTSKGAALQKSLLPMVKFSQELGQNTKVTARISPSRCEYANIGVSFNF